MAKNLQIRWQRGFLKIPSLESYIENNPLDQTLGGLTDLELVDFSNGLLAKPTRSSFELKEYFHTVKELFTDNRKGDGNPRVPTETIRLIQNYTDRRIHV